jgi:catechol 2,3-dioxygenase-like lactoylglutathione lyase family enzyme
VTVHHVALETRPADADAVVAFFVLLGFEEVPPPPTLTERARWVQRGATQVHVLYADDPVVPPSGHVAVVVPDYDQTLAALRAAGHSVEDRNPHWGSPRAFATTPGGQRVELMAYPPRD